MSPAEEERPCPEPGCGGRLTRKGYCRICGHRVVPARDESDGAAAWGWENEGRARRDGLFQLPDVPRSTPRLDPDPHIPHWSRFCADPECGEPVGRPRDGFPALDDGICTRTRCHRPFSFSVKLGGDDVLVRGPIYQVQGVLGHGSFGWVYLAKDLGLDRYVALKGILGADDEAAVRMAREEADNLARLDHPNIVRIITVAEHRRPDRGGRTVLGGPSDLYTVMEYVSGPTLREVIDNAARRRRDGQTFLTLPTVLTYGVQIAVALGYLHDRRLLYCDLKPDNVIHAESGVKLIDLGALRPSDVPTTKRYIGSRYFGVTPLERDEFGVTERADVFSLGRMLRELYAATDREPVGGPRGPVLGLCHRAFDDLVDRADSGFTTRFRSADEVRLQLEGVLRDVLAVSDENERPMRSTVFADAPGLIDDGLTAAPSRHWLRALGETAVVEPGTTADRAALDSAPPTPRRLAGLLPDPLPEGEDDEDDGAGNDGVTPPVPDPDGAGPTSPTVGVCLRAVRHALGEADAAARKADAAATNSDDAAQADIAVKEYVAEAEGHLERAKATADQRSEWRIWWYAGVVALAGARDESRDATWQARVATAYHEFGQVMRYWPGEAAPKVAVAVCAELMGSPEKAEPLYRVVWLRDRTNVNAAFGQVRIHLARGDRDAAVAVLNSVPRTSSYHDAAQVAVLRIRTSVLAHGADRWPRAEEFADAVTKVRELDLDSEERDRMLTAMTVVALRAGRTNGRFLEEVDDVMALLAPAEDPPVRSPAWLPAGLRTALRRVAGVEWRRGTAAEANTVHGAAMLACDCYRRLATRAESRDEYGALMDLAYDLRPRTRT